MYKITYDITVGVQCACCLGLRTHSRAFSRTCMKMFGQVRQLQNLARCHHLLEAEESNRFDWVVILRPDLFLAEDTHDITILVQSCSYDFCSLTYLGSNELSWLTVLIIRPYIFGELLRK